MLSHDQNAVKIKRQEQEHALALIDRQLQLKAINAAQKAIKAMAKCGSSDKNLDKLTDALVDVMKERQQVKSNGVHQPKSSCIQKLPGIHI